MFDAVLVYSIFNIIFVENPSLRVMRTGVLLDAYSLVRFDGFAYPLVSCLGFSWLCPAIRMCDIIFPCCYKSVNLLQG